MTYNRPENPNCLYAAFNRYWAENHRMETCLMNKNLKSWVAIGELIAAAGVLVSLIFVGFELRNGNKIQQAANDTFLFELQDRAYSDLSTDPVLLRVYMMRADGRINDITREEREHYGIYLWRNMNAWALAFGRYEEELLSDATWASWDRSYQEELVVGPTGMSIERWASGRDQYTPEFAAHVDSVYEQTEN
jgi:hypothetical protein